MVIYHQILSSQAPSPPLNTVLYCHCFHFYSTSFHLTCTHVIPVILVLNLLAKSAFKSIIYIGSITPEMFSGYTKIINGATTIFIGYTTVFDVDTVIFSVYTRNIMVDTNNLVGNTENFIVPTRLFSGGTSNNTVDSRQLYCYNENALRIIRKQNLCTLEWNLKGKYRDRLNKPKQIKCA